MAQAVVDPSELRRFAQNLKHFNNDLLSRMRTIQSQLIALGDSWRDQEHEKFSEEFAETMRVIEKFMEASQKHIPFLVRKAEKIEEYLQTR
jgi:uncharacterized protein YukE